MKMRKRYNIIILILVLACGSLLAQTQSPSIDQRQIEWFKTSTLKNVRQIYPQVVIEVAEKNSDEPDYASQIGPLTHDKLQNHVEQLLGQAGIQTTNRFNATSSNAPLSLNVTVFAQVRADTALPSYIVFVYTEALQPIMLRRNDSIYSFSRTWPMVPMGAGTRKILLLAANTIERKIIDEVTRQVNNFIKDYSVANPNFEINVKSTKDLIAQTTPYQMIPGMVINVPIEGGFWGLIAEDGTKYDPIELPEEFQIDGLKVDFQVKELEDVGGIHQWGKIVEIIKIEKQ